MTDAIAFLALARISDQAILASCFDKEAGKDEKARFEKALASMMELRAPTAYAGWKDSFPLDLSNSNLYAMADVHGLIITIVGVRGSKDYPERVAHQLLSEFAELTKESQGVDVLNEAQAGSLNKPLKTNMRDLMQSYATAGGQDKTAEVQGKVDDLKGIMQSNVKRILETHATLDQLQNNSQTMSTGAQQFLKQSADLRNQVLWRNYKVKALMGLCTGSIITYFALPFIPA